MKKVIFLIVTLFFVFPSITFALNCNSYEVAVSYPDEDIGISCHTDYNEAFRKMNEYPSTELNVAVIKTNGKIINAKYANAKIDVENEAEIQYKTDGVKNFYRTAAAVRSGAPTSSIDFLTYIASTWGSDAVFLDYDLSYNAVKMKISGVTGWMSKSQVIIIPISKYYSSTFNYPMNKPRIKTLSSVIRLRNKPSLTGDVIDNSSSVNGQLYNYKPSKTTIAEGYTWYYVEYKNGVYGWFANKVEENWIVEANELLTDTFYYTYGDILYHHVHKGYMEADVDMILGTPPYLYQTEQVKTYYLANSSVKGKDATKKYFSFDGNYFYKSYKDMVDDYRESTNNRAINSTYPHFSYFLYLPSRSKTGYSAASFDQMLINKGFTSFPINPKSYVNPNTGGFIKQPGTASMMFGIGQYVVNAQNKYGSNALAIYSNAIRESGNGTSSISFYKNNLFGMGAVDGNAFNGAYTYNSVEESVNDYAKKLGFGSGYSNLYDYRYNGTHEGNKLSGKGVQYASDPYSGESTVGNSFINDLNNGKLDNYANTVGIKTNFNLVNIFAEPSSNSRIIYQTKNYKNNRISINMPFIVNDYVETIEAGKIQGFYRVFTDVTLDSNRVYNNDTYYNFENCYGYIKKEDLYVANHQPVINATDISIKQFKEFKSTVTANDFENGDLTPALEVNGTVDTKVPGVYPLTYKVVDKENFGATKTINVTVTPTDSPIITGSDIEIPQFVEFNPLSGIKGTSTIDGDITNKITIKSGTLDYNVLGDYKIVYELISSNGLKTEFTRTIKVIPNQLPVIIANNFTVYLNETVDVLKNVTANDKEDGDLTSLITSTGSVDNKKVGSYQITYSVTDKAKQTTTKTITVTVEEKKFISKDSIFHLENLTFNDKTSKLDFTGFLIIKGMSNLVSTDIKYNIIFINQLNGKEEIKPLDRLTSGFPFEAPADGGFKNTGSWFQTSIPISDLPSGDYTVYVRARSGDFEAKTVLKNIFFNPKVSSKFEIGKKGFMFKTNYFNRKVPLELFVREEGLLTKVNNPTLDNMYNQLYEINLNKDKLNISGSSHNVNGNYGVEKPIERDIVLENIDTLVKTKTYNVGSITNGPYAISLKVPDGFSKTRAWFNTTLDLSSVPNGKYAIYVRTKAGSIDDFGELYDILNKNINQKWANNGKQYKLSRNDNIRYRIELTIE
ncbi:MAG: DUF5011 domain-containing protein [Bacilli bacterium]